MERDSRNALVVVLMLVGGLVAWQRGHSAGKPSEATELSEERALDPCEGETLEPATAILCGQPIDANRAGWEALALLPGIGPVKAKAIVETRLRFGGFQDIGDLRKVPGIGAKTAAKLGRWLRFDDGTGTAAPRLD
jgi:competence ComEA-like helix-hairpin-helix protein